MGWNYNGLWKILIDKGMNKTDLREVCKTSPNTITKLSKNEPVSMDILEKVCKALDCNISDIVEYVKEKETN